MFLFWLDSFLSIFSIRNNKSLLLKSISRSLVNTLIILMFTAIAFGLFKTLDNMATPCSVKTYGAYRNPILFEELEVTNWLLQFANSSLVSSNIKSSGKRFVFLFTCLFKYFVSTP